MATQLTRVESLCEEFSDWILYDNRNKSIILNVEDKFLSILKMELARFGFSLVHKTVLPAGKTMETVTCVFLHMK